MSEPTRTYLTHPLFRGSLMLHRIPKYLRFTCKLIASCSRNWDALDQLNDEPEVGEYLIAAKFRNYGSVHYDGRDKNGKRFGRWERTATYDLVETQPEQETMRDRDKWREWCEAQHAVDSPAEPPAELTEGK